MLKNNFKRWYSAGKEIDNQNIMANFESISHLQLPDAYKEMVRFQDGGIMSNYFFSYEDDGINTTNCPALFLCWQKETLEFEYIWDKIARPPEGFPQGLIPFALDGGGNYMCFDYRNCTKNPPIVFWNHECEEGKDVFYLAESFKDFINSLEEEKDDEMDH